MRPSLLSRRRGLRHGQAITRLRGLERDLRDGTQIRLATLAMNLGMAKKQLGDHSDEVPDAKAARELADARDQTITYLCAAELLAHAAKHSAKKIKVDLSERTGCLCLRSPTTDGYQVCAAVRPATTWHSSHTISSWPPGPRR